jgi:hypothetical protein
MGEGARGIVELALAGAPLDSEAIAALEEWLVGARAQDLRMLLEHAIARARRTVKRSPSGTLQAVREHLEPAEIEVLRRRLSELEERLADAAAKLRKAELKIASLER